MSGREWVRSGWVARGVYRARNGRVFEGAAAAQQATLEESMLQLGARGRIALSLGAAHPNELVHADPTGGYADPALLTTWGVPIAVAEAYAAEGITRLFPWQVDALRCANSAPWTVGDSLVYTAPTSGGKTLVAEVLMLRRLLVTGLPVVYVCPFVALVTEKARWLQAVWAPLGVSIRGFFNNRGGSSLDGVDVAVCTIERANGLVNRMIDAQRCASERRVVERCPAALEYQASCRPEGEAARPAEGDGAEGPREQIDGPVPDAATVEQDAGLGAPSFALGIGCLVLDEVHGVCEPGRGYLLELMVMKTLLMSAPQPHRCVQLVGLSATLPDIAVLAGWMRAHLFEAGAAARPVALSTRVVVAGVEFDGADFTPRRAFLEPHSAAFPDPGGVPAACAPPLAAPASSTAGAATNPGALHAGAKRSRRDTEAKVVPAAAAPRLAAAAPRVAVIAPVAPSPTGAVKTLPLASPPPSPLRVASNAGILAALVLETLTQRSNGCVLVFCATKAEVTQAARRICEALAVMIHGPHAMRRIAQRTSWANEDAARQRRALRAQQPVHTLGAPVADRDVATTSVSAAVVAPQTAARLLHIGPHEPGQWLHVSRQRLSEQLQQLGSGGETASASGTGAAGTVPRWVQQIGSDGATGGSCGLLGAVFDAWAAELHAAAGAGCDLRPFELPLHAMARLGVGIHHGGLLVEIRDVIESAFRSGTLNVLVATSTLAAGVNLPATRVIFRSGLATGIRRPQVHSTAPASVADAVSDATSLPDWCISQQSFRQMAGRAGRNLPRSAHSASGDFSAAPLQECDAILLLSGDPSENHFSTGRPRPERWSMLKSETVMADGRVDARGATPPPPSSLTLSNRPGIVCIARGLAETAGALQTWYSRGPLRHGALGALFGISVPCDGGSASLQAAPDAEDLVLAARLMHGQLPPLTSAMQDAGTDVSAVTLDSPGDVQVSVAAVAKLLLQRVTLDPTRRVHFRRAFLDLCCCGLLPSHISVASFSSLARTSLLAHLASLRRAESAAAGKAAFLTDTQSTQPLAEAVLFSAAYGFVSAEVACCKHCSTSVEGASSTAQSEWLLLWLARTTVTASSPDIMRSGCTCCLHISPKAFGRSAFLSSLAPEEAAMHAHELASISSSGLSTEDTLPSLFLMVPATVDPRAAPQDAGGWVLQSNLLLSWARGDKGDLLRRSLGGLGVTPELLMSATGSGTKARDAASGVAHVSLPTTGTSTAAAAASASSNAPQFRNVLLRRWFIAAILRDLTENEADVPTLLAKYGPGTLLDGGLVQAVQSMVSTHAGMILRLLRGLNWKGLHATLSLVAARLDAGVRSELLPLMSLQHFLSRGFPVPLAMLRSDAGVQAEGPPAAGVVRCTLPRLSSRRARALFNGIYGSGGGGRLGQGKAVVAQRSAGGRGGSAAAAGDGGGFPTPAALAAASVDAVAAVLRAEHAYETPSVAAAGGAEEQLAMGVLTLEQRCRILATGLIYAAQLAVTDKAASKAAALKQQQQQRT